LDDVQVRVPSETTESIFPVRLRPDSWSADPLDRPKSRLRRRHHSSLIVGLALAGLAFALLVYLATLQWAGAGRSPMADSILRIQIIGGALQAAIYVLAALSVFFLLARHPTRRRVIVGGSSAVGGAAIGIGILAIVAASNVLGVALSSTMSAWIIAGFALTALGIASFWSASGWRVIGTAFSVAFVLLASTLGVNADFGLDPTIGALAGQSTLKTITLPVSKPTTKPTPAAPGPTPGPVPVPSILAGGALWANWVAPAGMPGVGSQSQVDIPGGISGFHARPAGLYLPPAALVKNPPALPLVIMMMGQPGNPDPAFQATVLNASAARNNGLAPIVLVADQLGNHAADPLCLDTANYGKSETYITQDVVNWARTHLHILQDAAHWTIAGYSNGGECALAFAAKYPNIFQNVLDISGESFPGSDRYAAVLSNVFHGNSAAYRATWPINILKTRTYPDTVAVFTVGSNDPGFVGAAQRMTAATAAVGWKSTYYEIPNGGHVLAALNGGLTEGYSILYPRLGLSAPPG
jgi:enterochelin esterase-like enzyme